MSDDSLECENLRAVMGDNRNRIGSGIAEIISSFRDDKFSGENLQNVTTSKPGP
jgi:hypothetical protein